MRLSIIFIMVLWLAACGDTQPRYDSSSEEAIKQSIVAMGTALESDAQKQQFLTDLLTVSLSLQQVRDEFTPQQVQVGINHLLNGKTVKQIRRLAQQLDTMTQVERAQWLKKKIKI